MTLLSRLLLMPRDGSEASSTMRAKLGSDLSNLNRAEFDDLLTLADLNHVVVRGMKIMIEMMSAAKDDMRAGWATAALESERARISLAVGFLHRICAALEDSRFGVAVIKSLDHWPDLGSDLDLYSDAKSEDIARVMKKTFSAEMDARSWGDRLARKWNFLIPGLPESVEIHMGRLGQTGEQVTIASGLLKRSRLVSVEGRTFRVTHTSDRILISTLQRMYRHFYFRLCDVLDSAALIESGQVDFEDLRKAATDAEIWEGTAAYLMIVSDYVKQYRGSAVELPQFVKSAARFGGSEVFYARGFLRVPIMPQSAKLYGSQLAGLLRKRELNNGARLSLLPWLATAAVVGQKLTGSDKGIW
jgi:hypothetical protein